MKIIDFSRKGNLVRFYIGKDDLKEWYGDDWDDAPYEDNAGTVYSQYVSDIKDIAFKWNTEIMEPCFYGKVICKYDMVDRRYPMLILRSDDSKGYSTWKIAESAFAQYNYDLKYGIPIYMGDTIESIDAKLVALML